MVDTILMNLYNAFNCLPHELVKSPGKTACLWRWYEKLWTSSRQSLSRFPESWTWFYWSLWLKILFGPLLFNNISNDLLWSNICKFADGNTLYSCTQYLNDVIEDLPYYPKTVLKWFKDNRMMTNLGIFQFMILSKTTVKWLAIEIIKKIIKRQLH